MAFNSSADASPARSSHAATPLERALAGAYELVPEKALAEARRYAEAAAGRVDVMAQGPWAGYWKAMARPYLLERDKAARVLSFLEAIAAGKPAPMAVVDSVDAELVELWGVVRGPGGVANLLRRCDHFAGERYDAEASRINARIDGLRAAYSGGEIDLHAYASAAEALHSELAELEDRTGRVRSAALAVRESLRGAAAAVLDDLPSLRVGLREHEALARGEDAHHAGLVRELEGIDGDLARLALHHDDEPGRIGATLRRRREEVSASIKARRRELATATGSTAADLVGRSLDGDPDALAELVGAIRSRPDAFEADLADRLSRAIAKALAAGAEVLAGLID